MQVSSDQIRAGNTITVYGDTYKVTGAKVNRRRGFAELRTIDTKGRKSGLRIDLDETVDIT